ncbi:CHAT domain-containing protein [Nocardia cyriacigeorgica]|uniref:CHAT domain-containing protein n=1 Tax=Nocardia cyriacigeorgica TaxID=135487 RepID=UPI002454D37F|nr:CHAT domain-containing protein [Nocardia cyriacigeorgica]
MDVVVDLLIAHAIGWQARARLRVGELSGWTLDTVSTLVANVVDSRLGRDPAIDRLLWETRSSGSPSETTRAAARQVLESVARQDPAFRAALARAVAGQSELWPRSSEPDAAARPDPEPQSPAQPNSGAGQQHTGGYPAIGPSTRWSAGGKSQPQQGSGRPQPGWGEPRLPPAQPPPPPPAMRPPPELGRRERRRRRLRAAPPVSAERHGRLRDRLRFRLRGLPRRGRDVSADEGHHEHLVDPEEQIDLAQSVDDLTPEQGAPAEAIRDHVSYPRLEAPDVVVANEPFQVTVGLSETFDMATMVSGRVHVYSSEPEFEVDIEVLVDPKSLVIAGDPHIRVRVTLDAPYPRHTLIMRALTDPSLTPERTLRLIIRRQGRIIGLAARTLIVVATAARLATQPPPPPPPRQLLDLELLLDERPPDLVVVVYRADEPDTYVWDAYALSGQIAIPDSLRRSRIDHSARDYATYTRRLVKSEAFRGVGIFDNLRGYGVLVASALPIGIQAVLRELVRDRTEAPAVLWLTEEAFVPWELAVLDPPLHTRYAGAAPFLGAHLAMSRWPFSPEGPRPSPRRDHPIIAQAVLTADYEGVRNFPRLPAAIAEAARFNERYGPITTLPPFREQVIACLEGRIPVDLLHVALHGTFDEAVQEDGLVLLEPRADGFAASFLTALAVRGLRNASSTPFVYLNACSVGAGQSILGSYAGFATALLRTGAIGVVAPLWTIDDTVAAELAARFYDGAFADPPIPVAELLRRARAEYTRDRVAADPEHITPTHLGYLAFGHPRLTLRRNSSPER